MFNWKVSGANITKGQGTPKILVEPNEMRAGNATDIVSTIEIRGFPPECPNQTSCSLKVNPKCTAPDRFDSYGDLPFEDEKLRLDNLAAHLIGSGSDSTVYILAYAGRNTCLWEEAKLRAGRAKKYLIDNFKIEEDRIITFDGGYRDHLAIEMFLSPHKTCGPFPTPTIKTSEARSEGFCEEKYKNRKEPINS